MHDCGDIKMDALELQPGVALTVEPGLYIPDEVCCAHCLCVRTHRPCACEQSPLRLACTPPTRCITCDFSQFPCSTNVVVVEPRLNVPNEVYHNPCISHSQHIPLVACVDIYSAFSLATSIRRGAPRSALVCENRSSSLTHMSRTRCITVKLAILFGVCMCMCIHARVHET